MIYVLSCSVLEGGVRSRVQGTYLLLVVKDRGIMGNGESRNNHVFGINAEIDYKVQESLSLYLLPTSVSLSNLHFPGLRDFAPAVTCDIAQLRNYFYDILLLQAYSWARPFCRWRTSRSRTWTRTWRTCLSYYCHWRSRQSTVRMPSWSCETFPLIRCKDLQLR